jgi:drug/metabolite transporter (DMT)-like permease
LAIILINNKTVYQAIACMLFAVFLMVTLDVIAKHLLIKYSVVQMTFLRGLFSLVILGAIGVIRSGKNIFRTQNPQWHLARTILMVLSTFTFFTALKLLPLVNVMVIVFIAPIIIAALSGPLLGEKVGPWRWSAVMVGFIGVLVVLQPSSEFSLTGTIYALIGVITYALLSLTSRKLSKQESAFNLSFYVFFGPTILGGISSYFSWVQPNQFDWLLFMLCGLVGGAAFIFFNIAFQKAEASLLTTFEYTGLIWASLAGYFIFNEAVDSKIWLGALIIIIGGIIIVYRESLALKSSENSNP